MPARNTFVGGLQLDFLPSMEFESSEGLHPQVANPIIVRNVLRLLMMGASASWQELVSWSIFKAVFVRRDPELLCALRLAFQEGFIHVHQQLAGKNLNALQAEQFQLFISNCLSLLSLSDLTPYESITIPQLVNQQCYLVDYRIVPIELTDTDLIFKEEDRVFAYGLEPILDKTAQSHLIFAGTTYPAGQGFVPQINTDFKGSETVGYSLYQSGRERIEKWLSQQPSKAHVCGISLGGAISLLLAIDMGNLIARVDALNPPGLQEYWPAHNTDNWQDLVNKPKVVIQVQANDPVSPLGVWKPEWEIIHVIPPANKCKVNPFFDHFLNYAGFAETEFTYLNAQEENSKRARRNFWLYTLGRDFIYYTFLIPFNYVLRPCLSFIWQIGVFIKNIIFGKKPIAFVRPHDPSLPRNPSMDMYQNDLEVVYEGCQLQTYNKVMRILGKTDELVPEPLSEAKVALNTSKAKQVLILDTITLVNRLGVENELVWKNAVEEQYNQYYQGMLPSC